MQQEGSAKGMNPVFEKHWEKIVLGVVAVVAVAFLAMKFSGGGNKAAVALSSAEDKFKKGKDVRNDGIPAPKIDPKPEIPATVAVEAPTIWATGKRPSVSIDAVEREAPKDLGYHFPKVNLSAPKVDFDGVKLSWNLSDLTPDPSIKRPPVVVNPATFFFRVERKKDGETDFAALDEKAKGDVFDYIDTKTEPKTAYQYRVVLGTTDNAWNNKHQAAKGLTSQMGGPVNAKTLGIWAFTFQNIMQGDPDHEKDGKPDPIAPTVYVTITKHDPEAGKVTFSKITKEGAFLGVADDGTSIQSVFSPKRGRKVSVDFKSGGKITKINVAKVIPYEYKVCNRVMNDKGELECKGPEVKKDQYRVNEVIYTDEDGATQRFESPDGPGRNPDKLCDEHD